MRMFIKKSEGMSAGEKSKSSIKLVCLFIIAGIVVYTAILFGSIHYELNKGMVSNYETELINLSDIMVGQVQIESNQLKATSNWLARICRDTVASGEYDAAVFNRYSSYAMCEHHLEAVAVYDKDCELLSPDQYCSDFEEVIKPELIKKVLEGRETVDLVNYEGDVVGIAYYPITNGIETAGVAVAVRIITDDSFVELLSSYTQCAVTIFDGNVRKYTSIEDMQDTEIEDDAPVKLFRYSLSESQWKL